VKDKINVSRFTRCSLLSIINKKQVNILNNTMKRYFFTDISNKTIYLYNNTK